MTVTTGGKPAPDVTSLPADLRAAAAWLEKAMPALEAARPRVADRWKERVVNLRMVANSVELEQEKTKRKREGFV